MPGRPQRRGAERDEPGGSGVSPDWRWVLAPAAIRQLRRFSPGIQTRIIAELDLLVSGSPSVDIRKLEGNDAYRLRVGDYRVIYEVDQSEKTFSILKIADRKDSYR